MTAGFGLRGALVRLFCGERDGGELHDAEVFDAVAGSAVVAVVPLLYTSLRALAGRRRALIVRTAQSFSDISADARAVVVGEESTCSPFLPTSRSVLSVWIIIDAERAADVEFAKLFLMEVVCACVDGVFRGLMRTRCGRRMFRVCVFLARTAVGADAVVRLASSEGTGCCGVSTVAVEVAVSLSAPSLFRLRHGASLRRERRLHDAASRYLGPGVYLDSRWRSPEVADRVWRAMAPKGFATMWCCCVTGVRRPNCSGPRNGPAEYFLFGDLVRSRRHVRSTLFGGNKRCGYRRETGA
ncbi:hypothetical protein ECC02_012476 [Trypanosoma cruzi]|uniref:Uncharacterized protein n=1 Tax=Trypanosoma cruzi TaxID=5693 RepID=A0A7J6XKW5_TRYCR|nr:hypothetical protein ECC02_012476 [Trypanosoma cruzi]